MIHQKVKVIMKILNWKNLKIRISVDKFLLVVGINLYDIIIGSILIQRNGSSPNTTVSISPLHTTISASNHHSFCTITKVHAQTKQCKLEHTHTDSYARTHTHTQLHVYKYEVNETYTQKTN